MANAAILWKRIACHGNDVILTITFPVYLRNERSIKNESLVYRSKREISTNVTVFVTFEKKPIFTYEKWTIWNLFDLPLNGNNCYCRVRIKPFKKILLRASFVRVLARTSKRLEYATNWNGTLDLQLQHPTLIRTAASNSTSISNSEHNFATFARTLCEQRTSSLFVFARRY